VLRDLDLALRESKSHGPNRATAWQPTLTRIAVRRYTLAEELRRALDVGEFTLHYQPIIHLADGRLVGAEALLRWNHPSDGLVSPGTFIPVLEETALIVPVGCWAVHEAVRQMQSWRLLYGRDIIDGSASMSRPASSMTLRRCCPPSAKCMRAASRCSG
jgi:predicted signal transduction protein with EAL and GGDEF domain